MFAPHKDHRIEYISLYDPAIDIDAFDEKAIEEYGRTRNRSLLPLRAGQKPIIWTLGALDKYSLKYALATCPDAVSGGKVPEILGFHLCQVGIKRVENLPSDAPEFTIFLVGLLEKVSPDFIRRIPPEVAQELGGVILDLATATDEAKKKSPSPSAEATLKNDSPAPPAQET